MSIGVRGATSIEEARHQVDHGEYDGAWSTYLEFRDKLDEDAHDDRRLRMLVEAERAAESSLQTGTVGFESEMRTLLFVARRLVEDAETEP